MTLNPLRSLTGRLVLVTIIAIAISHAIAFWLFANERGRSIRRIAENNVIERTVGAAERIRAAPANEQAELAQAASDFVTRFSIVTTSENGSGGGAVSRLARAVSDDLGGARVHARSRVTEVEMPHRFRFREGDDGMRMFRDDRRGRPGDSPPGKMRMLTEVTIDVQLSESRWLRTQSYLPAPRPVGREVWFAALASLIAVGIGAALIARQIGRPLADLARAAERLGAGEPNVSAPVSGPDDVRRASTAFNAMAARLGRQLNRQRQMLWALSHDLRTPITALRLRAELIEDDAVRQRMIGPLAEMETLTEQALALARAGASEETRANVDLAEIARTLCGELQDIGLDVRAEAEAPVFATCRPSEIARAMRNLLENAAKYGGGGVVRVTRNAAGEAVIVVEDHGPGLSPDLIARATEPFFRADSARSQAANGAGLGLAIAQAIADSHGGRLALENRAPRGLSAQLILPG